MNWILANYLSAYAVASPVSGILVRPSVVNGVADCWQKEAKITMYWVAIEGSQDYDASGKIVTLGSAKRDKELKSCTDGSTFALVDENTFKAAILEGTVLLENGKTYNLGFGSECFMETDFKWGVGSKNNPLDPFASVAINVDTLWGKTVYIKELDGAVLPTGQKHNGCVRVDDVGHSFGDCQIDFLVGTFQNYQGMKKFGQSEVQIKECKVLTYSAFNRTFEFL